MANFRENQTAKSDIQKRGNYSPMTKATGVGRGGKRSGAGRKKNPAGVSVSVSLPPTGLSVEELAKHYAPMAIETLAIVASDGTQPASARVAAAKELIDRSEGKSKPAAAKPDQTDFADDGWGTLLQSKQPAAGRAN
jgi:hypothetical protein